MLSSLSNLCFPVLGPFFNSWLFRLQIYVHMYPVQKCMAQVANTVLNYQKSFGSIAQFYGCLQQKKYLTRVSQFGSLMVQQSQWIFS